MNWDFFLEKGRKFCNTPKKGGGGHAEYHNQQGVVLIIPFYSNVPHNQTATWSMGRAGPSRQQAEGACAEHLFR